MIKKPASKSLASASITCGRQKTTTLCKCRICDAPAQYSYYGAVVCRSCKIFFRRNALRKNEMKKKCNLDNRCQININNRHICSSCRLAKCFTNRMCVEMIRSSLAKPNKIIQKRKLINESTSTSLVTFKAKHQSKQSPTSNLLQSDQSTLSVEQWNLLSNLVHSFNEHSGYSFVERFIQDQNALPLKLRFKHAPVIDFFTSMMTKIQLVFEKNRDSLSFSHYDRTALLRTTAEYTSTIGGIFLMRQAHLFDYPSFYSSAEVIFRPSAILSTRRVIDELDSDDTFIKLVLAILSFSTMNYTVYTTQSTSVNLINIKALLPTQNLCTELTWRYLLNKYNHDEAVKRFTNVVRCLLLVNTVIVEAHESKEFIDIVDCVIEQTKQNLVA